MDSDIHYVGDALGGGPIGTSWQSAGGDGDMHAS